ncbi:hypothetical protein AVEN_12817-1 [Araneus ventricosus]|uniref:Retrotransposon gag domain-containing protein n=1 Tax=Araneus ventricosus TaxID=182803 RepID=A0A4Y2ABY7_ARAVE|nr:hypothetical protein AVEN_12817-1 [Araneus ventricosus]
MEDKLEKLFSMMEEMKTGLGKKMEAGQEGTRENGTRISWTVFKTQFDVVSSTQGWADFVKASQRVSFLSGSAVEILLGILADKLTDLTTIEKALEYRFGDSHLTKFYRAELKTRRQKSGESLRVFAADVERLMSLSYAEYPFWMFRKV